MAGTVPGQDRVIIVLQCFINTLKAQYTSRNEM